MSQVPNPTDTDQNVIYVLYQGTWKEMFAFLTCSTPKCLWAAAAGWELSACVSPELGLAALQGQSKTRLCGDSCPEVGLPGISGVHSLNPSCGWSNQPLPLVLWHLNSAKSLLQPLSLSLCRMFILSLFPSRLFFLMTHNIQTPCSLVKWILVKELH